MPSGGKIWKTRTTMNDPKVYATTQRTSKVLKAQIALSSMILIFAALWGVFLANSHPIDTWRAVMLFLAALAWRLIVGAVIWWNHA